MRRGALATLALFAGWGAMLAGVARAASPAHYQPPEGAPYPAEEVRVRTTGLYSLGGTFTTPLNGHRHPAVVLISGAGRQDRDNAIPGFDYRPFYDIADTLSRRGLAVLRLDDRGVGASTGKLDSMTLNDRAADARSALEFLRSRPDVDRNRIALAGYAECGWIANLLAAEDPEIAALVLMEWPGSASEAAAAARRRRSAVPVDSAYASLVQAWENNAARDVWWLGGGFDPIETARGVRAAVLILQRSGTDDGRRPVAAESLAAPWRGRGNVNVVVRTFDGLDPLLLRAADVDPDMASNRTFQVPHPVRGALAEWLNTRLDPDSEPKLQSPPPAKHRRGHGLRRRRH